MMEIKFEHKKLGRKSSRPSREELFKYRETHTVTETAEKYRVTVRTIQRWTKFYLDLEDFVYEN